MHDLRQLQTLLAVARTGSYTAAADELGYTQSAISYQMRQLQREAGTRLVFQAGRNLLLTQAGQVLVRYAETMTATSRAADQELATLAARGGAMVRLTAFQSVCTTFVPRVISWLEGKDSAPGITVHQAEPTEARTRVRDGEADIGLVGNWENEAVPDGEEAMLRIPLITDRRCVVMRRDHRLATEPDVEFADLAGERWVMERFRDRFMAACTMAGFSPHLTATCDDQMTVQSLVAAGMGITLMNELGLSAHMDSRLIARPLRNWPRRNTYALLWPDLAEVPAVATVLEAVQDAARYLQDAVKVQSPGVGDISQR